MAKTKKAYEPRPTDRLWSAARGVGWWFIGSAVLLGAGFWVRAAGLRSLAPSDYFSEADMLPGEEPLVILMGLLGLSVMLAYLTGAFLVLRWYLRSVRNAQVLHRGIETTPGWVVWSFIVPFISLIKPYTMTSELWRSSHRPDGWRGVSDPALLRWWWGLLLLGGFISIVGDGIARSAETAGMIQASEIMTGLAFGLQAVAGVLFLRIGGLISQRQTALVESGHRPPESAIPAWSA